MDIGRRPLGIVLTSAEIQDEGLERVLDNIQRAGATAISPALGVVAPARPGEGRREPPFDVAGAARLLDRPLWGQRELWIRSFTPHQPDPAIWDQVPYPPPALAPAEFRTDVPRQIIDAARRRHLRIDVQINPYSLPGGAAGQAVDSGGGQVNPADRPLRIDGRQTERVVSGHGCLNNPHVRALGRARMQETLKHYADVDGIYLDWAEYTTYFLEDCFVCFCDHCRTAATKMGYDWEMIERDTRALWDRLHRLTTSDLHRIADSSDLAFILSDWAIRDDGFAALLRFKADTVSAAAAELRALMNEKGANNVALGLNGFAPPWSRLTGMDYRLVSRICQQTRSKLFTFHWPMITRWWSETLLEWNPQLKPNDVLSAVKTILDVPSPPTEHRQTLGDYGMPRPDEPHPITAEALTRKINQTVSLAGDGAPCYAYVHSYRPPNELRQHLEAVLASDAPGCWIQRYGYLSDEKLAIVGEVWNAQA